MPALALILLIILLVVILIFFLIPMFFNSLKRIYYHRHGSGIYKSGMHYDADKGTLEGGDVEQV